MIKTQRETAGRASTALECMERRRDDREAAFFDLVPQRLCAARKHQATIERHRIGAKAHRFSPFERDVLRWRDPLPLRLAPPGRRRLDNK